MLYPFADTLCPSCSLPSYPLAEIPFCSLFRPYSSSPSSCWMVSCHIIPEPYPEGHLGFTIGRAALVHYVVPSCEVRAIGA
jgi:hypothetical protein